MRPSVDAIKRRSRSRRVFETTIVAGITEHKDDGFARGTKLCVTGFDERRADATPLPGRRDREGGKADAWRAPGLMEYPHPRKANMTDEPALVLCHHRQQEIAIATEIIDQACFLIA